MRQVNMHEAKTHLSRLVDEAAAGEEIVIARNGRPAARLVKVQERRPREYGAFRDEIEWLVSEEEMEEVDREIEAELHADDPDDPLLRPPPPVDQ